VSITRRIIQLTKAQNAGSRPHVQLYYLDRVNDLSGTSGTGTVAVGIIFPNGWCAQCWLTDHYSITFFPSIEEVKAIHGHDGATRVLIIDVEAVREMELP